MMGYAPAWRVYGLGLNTNGRVRPYGGTARPARLRRPPLARHGAGSLGVGQSQTELASMSEAEAQAWLQDIGAEYQRLKAETLALDAMLAKVRAFLQSPGGQAWLGPRAADSYGYYTAAWAAEIAAKGKAQHVLQAIKDAAATAGAKAGWTPQQVRQRAGIGEPITLTIIIAIVAALAAYTIYKAEDILKFLGGVSAEVVAGRDEAAARLHAAIDAAVAAGHLTAEAAAAQHRDVDRIRPAVTTGGLGWAWVAALGLAATMAGFIGGRATR